jgi:hypothetical protein
MNHIVYYQRDGKLYFYLTECEKELTLEEFTGWLKKKPYPELKKYGVIYEHDDGTPSSSSLEEMLLIIVRYYLVRE